jgi:aspartate 1-decarboxylase
MDSAEARDYEPRIVHVDAANRIVELGADPAAAVTGGLIRGDLTLAKG